MRVFENRIFLFCSRNNNSTVSVYGDTGMVDTRLHLHRGHVDTQVQPKKGPGSRYEIITPSAIAAVRGINFRVSAEANAQIMRSEVIEGNVLVTKDTAKQSIQEGFGLYVKSGDKSYAPVRLLPAIDKSNLPDTLEFLPLKLKWLKLDDARQYRIQIAPDYRFEELLLDRVVNKPEISFSDLADGDYALRIRGIDHLGLEGLNSVHFFTVNARPEAPMPLNPKDASNVYEAQPKLWWSGPDQIEKFHLQLSTDSEFKNRLIDKSLLKESFFIPERPLAWPRQIHAQAIQILTAAGAKVMFPVDGWILRDSTIQILQEGGQSPLDNKLALNQYSWTYDNNRVNIRLTR